MITRWFWNMWKGSRRRILGIGGITFSVGIILLAGCGGPIVGADDPLDVSGDLSSSETSPFTILSIAPTDGEIDLSGNQEVAIQFSDAIDPKSLGFNTITLSQADGASVSGTFSYDHANNIVIFSPSQPLDSSSDYKLNVKGILSMGGKQLNESRECRFRTSQNNSLVGREPKVEEINISDNQTDVPTDESIEVQLDLPVNSATLDTSNVEVFDKNNKLVDTNIRFDLEKNSVKVSPTEQWDTNSPYIFKFKDGVTGLDQTKLDQDKKISFQTSEDKSPPNVKCDHQQNGYKRLCKKSHVTLTFDQKMDWSTINNSSVCLRNKKDSGKTIPVHFDYNDNKNELIITPIDDLAFNSEYEIEVSDGATSKWGKKLKKAYTHSFWTSDEKNYKRWCSQKDRDWCDEDKLIKCNNWKDGAKACQGDKKANNWCDTRDDGQCDNQYMSSPMIVSTNPIDHEDDAPRSTSIKLQFNQAINRDTVVPEAFILTNSLGNPLAFDLTYDVITHLAVVTPKVILRPVSDYRLEVLPVIENTSCRKMAKSFVLAFTTAPAPDFDPPRVVWSNPVGEAPSAPRSTSIKLQFDQGLVSSSVRASNFEFTNDLGEAIPFNLTYDPATFIVVVDPIPTLDPSTLYHLVVIPNLKSLLGEWMEDYYYLDFTTAPAPK